MFSWFFKESPYLLWPGSESGQIIRKMQSWIHCTERVLISEIFPLHLFLVGWDPQPHSSYPEICSRPDPVEPLAGAGRERGEVRQGSEREPRGSEVYRDRGAVLSAGNGSQSPLPPPQSHHNSSTKYLHILPAICCSGT